MLGVEGDRQDAQTDGNIAPIQIQERLGVLSDGNRICDDTGGDGAPDVAGDVVTLETGSEQRNVMEEEDTEGRRGRLDDLVEKEENQQNGAKQNSREVTQEPSKELVPVEREGRRGKSDDGPQLTGDVPQRVTEEKQKAPDTKLKRGPAQGRDSETKSMRRPILPAPALSFPGTLARTHSSPSPCVLPSFYSSSFGHRIRAPRTPERHRAKTRGGFDKRGANERPASLERRGTSRHVTPNAPRSKIPSPDWWGSRSQKTKTTKTFMWGPQGPQETKSVCELQTRSNRWRGLDWCRGLGLS